MKDPTMEYGGESSLGDHLRYPQKIDTILEQTPPSAVRSQPIRLPTNNKKISEFSLYEAQQAAEYRDYCMYQRIVNSVNSPKSKIKRDYEAESQEKILSRRHSFTHLQELHYFNNPKDEKECILRTPPPPPKEVKDFVSMPASPTLIPDELALMDATMSCLKQHDTKSLVTPANMTQREIYYSEEQNASNTKEESLDNYSDDGIFDMDM